MKKGVVFFFLFLAFDMHANGAEICSHIFESEIKAEELIGRTEGPTSAELSMYILHKLEGAEKVEFQKWWQAYQKVSWKPKPVKSEIELHQQALYLLRLASIQNLHVTLSEKLKTIYKDPLRLRQTQNILEKLTSWERPLREGFSFPPSLKKRGLRIGKSLFLKTNRDWILDLSITAENTSSLKMEAGIATAFRYYRNTTNYIFSGLVSVIAFQLLNDYLHSDAVTDDEQKLADAIDLLNRDPEAIRSDIQQKIAQIDESKLTAEQREFLAKFIDRDQE